MPNEALIEEFFKKSVAEPPAAEKKVELPTLDESAATGEAAVEPATTTEIAVDEPPIQGPPEPAQPPSTSELLGIGAQSYVGTGMGFLPSNPFGNEEHKKTFWGGVGKSFATNWDTKQQLYSAGKSATGVIEFFMPTRGWLGDYVRGEDRPYEGFFPGMRDFVQLMGEVNIKFGEWQDEDGLLPDWVTESENSPLAFMAKLNQGVRESDFNVLGWKPFGHAAPSDSTTPMLDGMMTYLAERWDITDPAFPEKFGEMLATDFTGTMEDLSLILSVVGWGVGGAAGVAGKTSKFSRFVDGKWGARMNKFGIHPPKVAKALANASDDFGRLHEFLMSSVKPEAWTLPGMSKVPGLGNKLARFGSRWGATDFMDVGMWPPMMVAEMLRSKTAKHYAGKIARFAEQNQVSGGLDIRAQATEFPRIDEVTVENGISELGGVVGNPQILRGPEPEHRWESRYAVVPITSLAPSHVGREVNPRFTELGGKQFKDPSTKEAQDFINHIAETLDPEQMNQMTLSAVTGSPIIDYRGVVESGNVRTLATLKVIAENPELYKQLQDHLREMLPQIGIDPDVLNSIENGILVRVRTSDLSDAEHTTFVRAANEDITRRSTAAEVSELDLDYLTPQNLRKFQLTDARTMQNMLNQESNRDFIASFVNELPQAERTAFLNNDQFKGQLIERVENALVRFAYPGESGQRFTQDIIESTDEGLRNISNTAVAIAPRLIELRLLVQNNARTPDFDIAADIADAVVTYNRINRESVAGRTTRVYDYLHRLDFLNEPTAYTPITQALMYFFEQNKTRFRDLREPLIDFLDTAIQGDMFRPQTAEALLKDVLKDKVEDLDEVLVDLDPVPTTETTIDKIDTATDSLQQNARISEYGEKVGNALNDAGTQMELKGNAALEQAITEMQSTGELSQGTLVQLNTFLNSLTPEVLAGFRQHLEGRGIETEFLDKLPLRPLGEFRERIDLFHRLTLDPRNEVYGQVGLGWAFNDLNRPNQAIERFTAAIQRNPEDTYGYTGRANVLLRQGEVDEALLDIDRALELDPNNAYAYSQRGYVHKTQGDEPSANRDFDRAEHIMQRRWAQDAISEEAAVAKLQQSLTGSETADSMAYVAWQHWGDPQDSNRKQNLNRMVARAREAVKLDGGHLEGHGALAVGLYNLGKRRIFEANQSGVSDAQQRARRAAAQKYFEQAGEAADSLLTLDPNSSIGLNIKGWTLNQLGRTTEGRQLTDAAQAAEAREGTPEARDPSDIVADAHDSVLFLEDAKQNITVAKDEETGISTVTYQKLNAEGQPETVTRQMRGTDDQVQAAIDQEIRRQFDADIARYRQSADEAGADEPSRLDVTDEDVPTTAPDEPTTPDEPNVRDLEIRIEKSEIELNRILEDLQTIDDRPLDGRTREGQEERDVRRPQLERQRDTLQEQIDEARTQIEDAGRTPRERLEHRLQQIEDGLAEIRSEGDTNAILRREREGETGLLGDLHLRRHELHQERDTLRQQLDELPEDAPDGDDPPSTPDQIADLDRRISNLNDSLQQTDGINRSQEIRQQIQTLEEERNRLTQQADDEIPFDAPDDGAPPPEDVPVARQPEIPSMPIEIVEEFYRYLKTNADANPEVSAYANSLGALTADLIEELSKTRPELKDLFDAYKNAEQIVANHARANFIDYVTQKFGNAVDNVEEYQKLVDQVFDSTSIEDISEIKQNLNDADAGRLEGAFWKQTLDTWMRGGEAKIQEMLDNGLLNELVGPERVEAINYFDNIVAGYLDAKERGRSVKQPTAADAQRINAKLEQIAEGARQRAAEARAEETRIAEEIAEAKAEIDRVGTVDEAERLEGGLESEENFQIAQQRLEENLRGLEIMQKATQAKARYAEAQAELVMIQNELTQNLHQEALASQQQRNTPDAGRQADSFDDTLDQAGKLGQQREQDLMSRKEDALAKAKAAAETREQVLNQMLEQQQTASDAGRQADSFDDTLDQAGEVGVERRQAFIKQEQREIAEAKENIESREQAFNQILQRQDEGSHKERVKTNKPKQPDGVSNKTTLADKPVS